MGIAPLARDTEAPIQKSKNLQGFYFVAFELNCDRSMNHVHRNHKTVIIGDAYKDPLQALECAVADSYPLAGNKVMVRAAFRLCPDQTPNRLDLFGGNRACPIPWSDEPEGAVRF
jgi:hypothetical protein